MRILIATQYLPWPPDSGGNVAQFATLKSLAHDHEFTLVCPLYHEAGLAHAEALRRELPNVRVREVFCGTPAPAPPPPPRVNLAARCARWGLRQGRRWLSPPPPISSPVAIVPEEKPYFPFYAQPEKFLAAVDEEVRRGPDLCQAEFADMLSLGAWLPKDIPKVFVHHQVHFVYCQRFLAAAGRSAHLDYLEATWRMQEIAYLKTFDTVVTFSAADRERLLPYLEAKRVVVSPFPLPADAGPREDNPAGFDGRFLFLASEEHGPNRDALEWLLAKIWPCIRASLPEARLVVAGKWSESARARLAANGVIFAGFVPDLADVLRRGILLAPLRIGSGIRVKIMSALAQGVAVVTTEIGCEGMPVRDGHDLLIRNEPGAFAAAAVTLAGDPELRGRLGANGRSTMSAHYSPESVRARRNEIYRSLATRNSHEPKAAVILPAEQPVPTI